MGFYNSWLDHWFISKLTTEKSNSFELKYSDKYNLLVCIFYLQPKRFVWIDMPWNKPLKNIEFSQLKKIYCNIFINEVRLFSRNVDFSCMFYYLLAHQVKNIPVVTRSEIWSSQNIKFTSNGLHISLSMKPRETPHKTKLNLKLAHGYKWGWNSLYRIDCASRLVY